MSMYVNRIWPAVGMVHSNDFVVFSHQLSAVSVQGVCLVQLTSQWVIHPNYI